MKFGDKLIFLRKKHGFSQEDLASKLNVSRQSVSKWESNNTYPETDKIIQICNIFDCRMDDLINDKVTDISECDRKSKKNFTIAFDSLLEFITKSINMFSSMKLSNVLKTIIELGILALLLFFVGNVAVGICNYIIMNIFSFTYGRLYVVIDNIITGILNILSVGLQLIIFIHIYKIRYLDYYDKLMIEGEYPSSDNINEKDDNNNEIKKEKIEIKNKEPRIIIRDNKHEPFAFLSIISKIILACCKFCAVFVAIGFAITLIFLVISLVVCLSFGFSSILFLGLDIGFLASIVINLLILLLVIYFIISKKINLKLVAYTFLAVFTLFGIGCGMALVGIKDFTYVDKLSDDVESTTISKKINFKDNLIINEDVYNVSNYKIVIDDSLKEEIIINADVNSTFINNELYTSTYRYYGFENVNFWVTDERDFGTIFRLIIKDIKNHTIRDYSEQMDDVVIKCNSDVAKKLISNMHKVFLFEIEKTDYGYFLNNIRSSINDEEYYGVCTLRYNAFKDEFYYNKNNCSCKKEVLSTIDGNEVNFVCDTNI